MATYSFRGWNAFSDGRPISRPRITGEESSTKRSGGVAPADGGHDQPPTSPSARTSRGRCRPSKGPSGVRVRIGQWCWRMQSAPPTKHPAFARPCRVTLVGEESLVGSGRNEWATSGSCRRTKNAAAAIGQAWVWWSVATTISSRLSGCLLVDAVFAQGRHAHSGHRTVSRGWSFPMGYGERGCFI